MDSNIILKPFVDLFSRNQLHLILLAWLPTKLNPYLSGIITVDSFIITIISSAISSLIYIIIYRIKKLLNSNALKESEILTVQIEYYERGSYNENHKSIIYESLSWLISQQIKSSESGSFILKAFTNNDIKDKPIFANLIILPETNQKVSIKYKGITFNIQFKFSENTEKSIQDRKNNIYGPFIFNERYPSIYLSTYNCSDSNITINKIYELLNEISHFYLENQKKVKCLFRYENNNSNWIKIQKLSSRRGLESISLDKQQEILIKKELESFVNDKIFYEKIGIPYKKGILLYGNPGTGKTSLINAISNYLSRDIYYLNLKNINNDNELYSLFSSVPSNMLIVIEDVDTQTNILNNRKVLNKFVDLNYNDKQKKIFTLSSFLTCLDGHIISEGNIIIMTTNHIELLDPACIRPGRMDIQLELGNCTHYQLNKLFKTVINESGLPDYILKEIPEKLLPPCEVMTLFMLHKKNNNVIEKLNELVIKYKSDIGQKDIKHEINDLNKKRKFNE